MSATDNHFPVAREVVGTFADRDHFQQAVTRLLADGFTRADLSVLSSHDSLDATQPGNKWKDALVAVAGDIKYEGPLVAAGLIALASGPVGVAIAAMVAAGIGGMAVKEVLDEVSAFPETSDFERALEAGSVILWVMVADQLGEEKAKKALAETGAANIHVFNRKGR
ncbi:MAG: hypothetical protein LDL39_01730 [Magnetospirillum sp.]|nr:hypothetical protein [Magnetospirillum sp.]